MNGNVHVRRTTHRNSAHPAQGDHTAAHSVTVSRREGVRVGGGGERVGVTVSERVGVGCGGERVRVGAAERVLVQANGGESVGVGARERVGVVAAADSESAVSVNVGRAGGRGARRAMGVTAAVAADTASDRVRVTGDRIVRVPARRADPMRVRLL